MNVFVLIIKIIHNDNLSDIEKISYLNRIGEEMKNRERKF